MKKRFRLTSAHPDAKKVEQAFALMDELGIQFFSPNGNVEEAKVKVGGVTYELVDIEEGHGNTIRDLPPATEYKLVYEKESPAGQPHQRGTQKSEGPDKQDKNPP